MDLVYTYRENNICNVMSSLAVSELMNTYHYTFFMVKYLLKRLFGISVCTIDLISRDDFYSLMIGIKLKIKSGKDIIYLDMSADNICFNTKDESYNFSIDGLEARLEEMSITLNNKVVTQKFMSHMVQLDVQFKTSGKVCFLEIPIDLDETISLNICNIIKEENSLVDLKNFYARYFYKRQSDYDKNNVKTLISFWNNSHLLDSGIKEKGIKLDEITLINNKIINYQLTKKMGSVMVTLKDGLFTVMGYPPEDKTALDINQTFNDLLLRQRKLDSR